MSIQLTFLGTSCSTPTKERNLSSVALRFRGDWFLFDTPEGLQQQLMRTHLSHIQLEHVFISHFHADHTLGLPGIIATMTIHERKHPLHVWGPKGIEGKVKQGIAFADFFPGFEIKTHEIKEGTLVDTETYRISAVKLNHSCLCYGFVFETKGKKGTFIRAKALKLKIPEGPLWGKLQKGESVSHNGKKFTPEMVMDYTQSKKGVKIALVMDTFPHNHYVEAMKGCDYLIHESSFMEDEKERAWEVRHSTARMAGEVAKKMGVKKLFLTHFSPRYPDGKEMVKEAKPVFANVVAAHDLMKVELEESVTNEKISKSKAKTKKK